MMWDLPRSLTLHRIWETMKGKSLNIFFYSVDPSQALLELNIKGSERKEGIHAKRTTGVKSDKHFCELKYIENVSKTSSLYIASDCWSFSQVSIMPRQVTSQ